MASGGCGPETHPRNRSLDLSGIQQEQPVWLVKVPKYLSQQWAGASGSGEVGKLQVVQNPGQPESFFTLNEELTRIQDPAGGPVPLCAPREHQVLPQRVRGQALAVMTEDAQARLSLEGAVVQRLECRPAAGERYLRLKRMQIERSLSLARTAQILDMPVTTNYRPVANHRCNIEYEKKKKEDGKRVRADKDQVLALLFAAFEKHQYYCLKDLVGITLQPVLYLKEILREIAVRVVQGPHKNSWQLKAEYRHYPAAANAKGAGLHPGKAALPKIKLGGN